MSLHILKVCEDNNYLLPTMTNHYGIICISQFLFTYGLLIKVDETGYNRRYCYSNLEDAINSLNLLIQLDNLEDESLIPFDPPDNKWLKRKGNPYEITNPNLNINK